MNVYKLLNKLPLCIKRKLRNFAVNFYLRTEDWVVDSSICRLIENTPTPDFEAYQEKLDAMEKSWGQADGAFIKIRSMVRIKKFLFEKKGRKND